MAVLNKQMDGLKHLKMMSITWNMAGETPNAEMLDKLLLKSGVVHDMYVIASQEAIRSIPMSVINPNKEEFNQIVVDYFAGKLEGQKL